MKYLLLGVGEVGLTIARKLLTSPEVTHLHIHTASRKSLLQRLKYLRKVKSGAYLSGSYGDIFSVKGQLNSSNFPKQKKKLLKYLYDPSETPWYSESLIHELISYSRPDFIIDTVTLATYFTNSEPSDLYVSIRDKVPFDIENLLLKDPATVLTKFVEALRHSLRKFRIKHYIKVSSSGLGGMGFNCPYTHNSINGDRLNAQMQSKIAASGILQQLLWNLSDSEASKISLVIPKALIGWDEPFSSKNTFNEFNTSRECKNYTKIRGILHPTDSVRIPCGDSTSYSIEEVVLASAAGQFETITKEEVCSAVLAEVRKTSRHNALFGLERSTLKPSTAALRKKLDIIKHARILEMEESCPSLVSGNFGPYASKLIAELFILLRASGGINDFETLKPLRVSQKVSCFLEVNRSICDQIERSKMILQTEKNHITQKTKENMSTLNPNLCVDIRVKNIRKWQKTLKDLKHFGLLLGIECLDSLPIGELVALYFRQIGKCRKRYISSGDLIKSRKPLFTKSLKIKSKPPALLPREPIT